MLGYPGSGKTTTAKIIHDLTGGVHLWADQIRRDRFGTPTYTHEENLKLYKHLNQLTSELLATGQDVIFDTNFNFYKDRQHLREIASEHNAQTRLVWVIAPKAVARQRATSEAHLHSTRILGEMPVEQFERLAGNLQEPREDEAFVQIDGTQITPAYIREKLALE
jgi:predicted kinase